MDHRHQTDSTVVAKYVNRFTIKGFIVLISEMIALLLLLSMTVMEKLD